MSTTYFGELRSYLTSNTAVIITVPASIDRLLFHSGTPDDRFAACEPAHFAAGKEV